MFQKIKEHIDLIFIIIVVIIIFLWGRSCGNNNKEINPTMKIDTVIVHRRDTIFPKDTIYHYKITPSKPRIDTLYKVIYLDSGACNRVYVYKDSIKTKEYNIYSKAYVQGLFRNLDLDVKLKVPLEIHDSTTITINKDSLIYKLPKYQLDIGIMAGFKSIAPVLDLSINRSTYTIGYDPFNNYPVIGYKYKIFKSKK